MTVQAGYSVTGFNWLTLSLLLFALTGILWLGVLLPMQRSMIRHSAQAIKEGTVSNAYWRVSRYWGSFGIAATLLPIVVLYLMIARGF